MNWKCYLGCTLVLALGVFCGANFPSSAKYEDGRLSACKDMLSVLNANPAIIQCVMYKGEAAIKVAGNVYFSLDGTKTLN